MSESSDPNRPTRPTGRALGLLAVAGTVVTVQALTLIVIAILEGTSIESARVGLGVSTAIFLGGLGLLLIFGVVQILGGHAWARGLLVFAQLLALLLSFNFRGDTWWIPFSLAGSALVALGCLLAPAVTQALSDDNPM